MSEKINERIIELIGKQNLDPAEIEAEIKGISEAIHNEWADISNHVITPASLPPEVFGLLLDSMADIRECINENDRLGYADTIPQEVVFGHLLVEGTNALFEKHAQRERLKQHAAMEEEKRAAIRVMRRKMMEAIRGEGFDSLGGPAGMKSLGGAIAAAMASAGAVRVPPSEQQLDEMEQFIKSKFGPDAKIERGYNGFDVAVPSDHAPDPKEVLNGLKDILGGGEISLVVSDRPDEQPGETMEGTPEGPGCNGDCENCSANPLKALYDHAKTPFGKVPDEDNGEVVVADEDHGVIIMSNEGTNETANESLN